MKNFTSFLNPFYFLFLLHLAVAVTGDSLSTYTPTERIFLACGLSGTTNSLDGRTWIGDIGSEYSPLETQKDASKTFVAPQVSPYSASRVSHSQFTYRFNVTSGQKFIRLYFYSTSYSGFNSSKAFFSVEAGSFTLLRNFSASLTADALSKDKFFKEFCVNVGEDLRLLNITFTPSADYQDSYAFINGIEIVSMPSSLYYTAAGDQGFIFVGHGAPYSISNSNALETLYRINVGGMSISPQTDTGMYRAWDQDDDYVTDARPSVLAYTNSTDFTFGLAHNYSAPVAVYQTARTMGLDKENKREL